MAKANLSLQEINIDAIKHYAALRNLADTGDDALKKAADSVIAAAVPQGLYQQVFYDDASHAILCDSPFTLSSQQLRTRLEHTGDIVLLLAATLGPAVDEAIDRLFLAKDFQDGLLLDAAASAAADQLLGMLTSEIASFAAKKGYAVAWQSSPGCGDWPQGQQADLAIAAGGAQIGITVTASRMLIPRKTITAITALRYTGDAACSGGCAACAMAGNCHAEEEDNDW
ncbi:vitamin B12-dependent methionine synthase activation domain protein [Megasphaera vaginalis (ex Srinivasan et al. 2021)]|uniref:Vitamin B12-dependent methionine synthase, activation domain protein n=1 Tax=Megasphaera vaginalis (ex Srinivasan et al. 2021) TaxID=1111454 RepID=U7UHH3_9FIRM|nr:vitamin B12-dependent methionine synthase activation domain protein [Megasphaera vaginalis (ex Srinivasan et al. 2021)]ERT58746.1 vitamin B12-dependent methionine synthase, activation domain protein [Megasphaera vaginalis (ex Srinivasan et al. 2021)]